MVASPIEADADDCLPDLRQVLAEANAGLARATTQKNIYKAVEFPKRNL